MAYDDLRQKWQKSIIKTIGLTQTILRAAGDPELVAEKFDDAIASPDALESHSMTLPDESDDNPRDLTFILTNIDRLLVTLDQTLPIYQHTFDLVAKQNGKPTRLVRYWLPATALLVSCFAVPLSIE